MVDDHDEDGFETTPILRNVNPFIEQAETKKHKRVRFNFLRPPPEEDEEFELLPVSNFS